MKHQCALASLAFLAAACGNRSTDCTVTQAIGGLSISEGRRTARLVVTHVDGSATQCAALVEPDGPGIRVRTAGHCVNPATARQVAVRPDFDLAREWPVDSPALRFARALDEAPVTMAARTWALRRIGARGPAVSTGQDQGLVVATYGEAAFLSGPAVDALMPPVPDAFPAWTKAQLAHSRADVLGSLAGLARGLSGCKGEDPQCMAKDALLAALAGVATAEERAALTDPVAGASAEEAAKRTVAERRDAWEDVRKEVERRKEGVRVEAFDRVALRPGSFSLYPLIHFEVRDQGVRWGQSFSGPLKLQPGDSGSPIFFRDTPILVVSSVASDAVSGGASVIALPVRRKDYAAKGPASRQEPAEEGGQRKGREQAAKSPPLKQEVACR